MTSDGSDMANGDLLLEMRALRIDGQSGEEWHEIIKGINIDLRRGEVLGLIGESGAGKSTVGLAVMGFARPGCRITGGSIIFDGMDLMAASEDERRKLRGVRIAYVSQSAAASFNPAHRLIDQFSEVPFRHGKSSKQKAEADAKDIYKRLLLPDPDNIGYRYPHQVSGGQLQRAMTAMALACRPDLIVFDEPTTALDVTTQIEVLVTIRDIVDQFNTAAIYISHDLAVVAQLADRIMVLRYGELVEENDTNSMMSSPREDYTRTLWAVRTFQKQHAVAPHPSPLIKVDHVTAGYGPTTVLDDVSFEIHRGQTVGVVGESGSGKSTAARVITGLLPPKEGRILLNGEMLPGDYRKRSKDQLRRAQMIYQTADTAVNPRHCVRDIIGRPLSFYLGMKGQPLENRIRELLDMIELEPDQFIDRFPGELSGGQKQRICIARALAAEPEFIICDEVTSALDQIVAEGILRLLDRLQREFELSYMFISHDLSTIRAIADDVIVMLEGRIVEQGPTKEIFTPPHHDYTDLLLSSVPEMDPTWLDRLMERRRSEGLMPSTSTS
jgi:peptide/nickel transport system ATP-binding protein